MNEFTRKYGAATTHIAVVIWEAEFCDHFFWRHAIVLASGDPQHRSLCLSNRVATVVTSPRLDDCADI